MKKNSKSKYSLYGLPKCETVKKAMAYLEKNKITYQMIDFKKTPPTESDIKRPILEIDGSVEAVGFDKDYYI